MSEPAIPDELVRAREMLGPRSGKRPPGCICMWKYTGFGDVDFLEQWHALCAVHPDPEQIVASLLARLPGPGDTEALKRAIADPQYVGPIINGTAPGSWEDGVRWAITRSLNAVDAWAEADSGDTERGWLTTAREWLTALRDNGGPDLTINAHKKLAHEAAELAATPTLEEAADVLICLEGVKIAQGWADEDIRQAVAAKVIVNSERTWRKEPDGTWQHVGAGVVSAPAAQPANDAQRDAFCFVDDCPSDICGGPHRRVETSLGFELLRYDQQPIGTPVDSSGTAQDTTEDQ